MRDFSSLIRDVPDFPAEGILFRDITPLLLNADAFRDAVDAMTGAHRDLQVDCVAAVESRGFIFGAPLSLALNCGLALVRKPGKLPGALIGQEYDLEYGSNRLEVHSDAILPGQRVLIVDDVLATGGTAAATATIVEQLGGVVCGLTFLIEIRPLNGRAALPGKKVHSLISY